MNTKYSTFPDISPSHSDEQATAPKSSKKKRISTRVISTTQKNLFNLYGDPSFNSSLDALYRSSGSVEVGEMSIKLSSSLGTPEYATRLILEALKEFRHVRHSPGLGLKGRSLPLSFETWSVKFCVVSFQRTREDRVVRADYTRATDTLELLLPHSTTWRECGLYWITEYEPCCDRNRIFPTPWHGRPCQCMVDECHETSTTK